MTNESIAVGEPSPSSNRAKDPMLQFFEYGHLPRELQKYSEPFYRLARLMVDTLPRNPERTVGLRKLLEAKDCAVRASIFSGEA